MRFFTITFFVVMASIGSGCGHAAWSSGASAAPYSESSSYAAGRRVQRGAPSRSARGTSKSGGMAVLHGDNAIPLRSSEAAAVRTMLAGWYWSELRSFSKRSPTLAAEFTTLSPSALSVSVASRSATFFLDGYRYKNGRLHAAPSLRNGRPDRGEASLLDLTGSSQNRAPIPSLGSHAGRPLALTASRVRCVPDRSSADDAAVSAALSALAVATRD